VVTVVPPVVFIGVVFFRVIDQHYVRWIVRVTTTFLIIFFISDLHLGALPSRDTSTNWVAFSPTRHTCGRELEPIYPVPLELLKAVILTAIEP
jgi:hypothetical protein